VKTFNMQDAENVTQAAYRSLINPWTLFHKMILKLLTAITSGAKSHYLKVSDGFSCVHDACIRVSESI
jgi:hypothetical protein